MNGADANPDAKAAAQKQLVLASRAMDYITPGGNMSGLRKFYTLNVLIKLMPEITFCLQALRVNSETPGSLASFLKNAETPLKIRATEAKDENKFDTSYNFYFMLNIIDPINPLYKIHLARLCLLGKFSFDDGTTYESQAKINYSLAIDSLSNHPNAKKELKGAYDATETDKAIIDALLAAKGQTIETLCG